MLQRYTFSIFFSQVHHGPFLSCPEAGIVLNMGRAREVGWMAAGLMIGAGACYCVYKLTIGRDESDNSEEEEEQEWEDDQDTDEEDPESWFDFTAMARPWSEHGQWNEPGAPDGSEDRHSGGGKANRAHPTKQRPFPYEHKNTWSARSCKNASGVVHRSKCPFFQAKSESKYSAFALSYCMNSALGNLSMGGNAIPTPILREEEQALWVLESSSASVRSQGQRKISMGEVCREAVSCGCCAMLQQAGLDLLISMAVINGMIAKCVSDLEFPLIAEGSGHAEVQISRVPLPLSAKPALVGEVFSAQALLSFMSLLGNSPHMGLLLQSPVL